MDWRILRLAEQLDAKAVDFINAINDYLNDPNNPENLERLNKLTREMKDLLKSGTDLAKDTAYDIPQETSIIE